MLSGRERTQLSSSRFRSPAWRDEAAFLARFEDEPFVDSELDWVEVLDPESHAIVVGLGGEIRKRFYNEGGKPSARVWAIRVANCERTVELHALLGLAMPLCGIEEFSRSLTASRTKGTLNTRCGEPLP